MFSPRGTWWALPPALYFCPDLCNLLEVVADSHHILGFVLTEGDEKYLWYGSVAVIIVSGAVRADLGERRCGISHL